MEWHDDVRRWRAGDAAAKERLREYLMPFVHGALLAHTPHHVANALVSDALDAALANPDEVQKDAQLVVHAVGVGRRLAKRAKLASTQERPSTDSTVADGRQWLERLRALPDEVRECVLWRLAEGVPGPELVEVLGLEPKQLRITLERGIGETLVPPQSLAGAEYVWDLAGEPSTALARAETYAMALRFDPLAPPEPADVVNTAATFQDLSNVRVGARPEANPFGDFAPTRVHPSEAKGVKLQPAGQFDGDEKTEGGFDLPAAARGLVPKTEPATPAVKTSGRQALVTSPPPQQRSEPKVAKVVDDDRPSRRGLVLDERPSRKVPPAQEPAGRRETLEAPIEVKGPAQTKLDDDERPSRSRLQVRGKLDRERGEESGRKRNPELGEDSGRRRNPEHGEESGRKRNPELSEERKRLAEPDSRRNRPTTTEPEARSAVSGITPIGPVSEPSLEPTDPEGPPRHLQAKPMPIVTEKLVPQPVNPAVRAAAIGAVVVLLLLAVVWRLFAT